MVRIDVETLISRPVQEVWDFFLDFTNSSRWTRSGSELRQTSEGPLGVGATFESVRSVFGREIKSQAMVATHYEPGRLVSFTTAVALLGNAVGGFTFENVAGATRLARWTVFELGPATGVLGPIIAWAVHRGHGTELANLKRLIEARVEAPGRPRVEVGPPAGI